MPRLATRQPHNEKFINLEAALEFVRSRGNIVEQARLNYLLDNERPSPEAANTLLAGRRQMERGRRSGLPTIALWMQLVSDWPKLNR